MRPARRRFLTTLALAPLAPGALAAPAGAQGTAQPTPEASDPVAEALAEAIRRQFGAHLDEAELAEVRRELERNRAAAARLRAAARLANADEPVCRFEARPRGARRTGTP